MLDYLLEYYKLSTYHSVWVLLSKVLKLQSLYSMTTLKLTCELQKNDSFLMEYSTTLQLFLLFVLTHL